jgi:hypothetical protein
MNHRNWYKPGTDESQAIGTIIATIEDYCQDFKVGCSLQTVACSRWSQILASLSTQARLIPEYFRKLINETHQRYLVFYCRPMFVIRSAKINRQVWPDQGALGHFHRSDTSHSSTAMCKFGTYAGASS